MTYEEIAKDLGMSVDEVIKTEKEAMDKLRNLLINKYLAPKSQDTIH